MPRTTSKWPIDKIVVNEIKEDAVPVDEKAKAKFNLLAGLVA